jgi:hypothetical protein
MKPRFDLTGRVASLACVLLAMTGGCSDAGDGAAVGFPDATVRDSAGDVAKPKSDVHLSSGGDTGSPSPTLGCSADLRSVIDASGNVVSTCADDQGCSGGKCVDACAAAAASHGSLGCDFWVSTPITYDVEAGQGQPCFGMFVANAWPKDATLTVARNGVTYDPTTFGAIPSQTLAPSAWPPLTAQGVPVNNVVVLYLSGAANVGFVEDPSDILSCPQATATGNATEPVWSPDAGGGASGKSYAFHVTSNVPVTAYDIFPFGGANSHFPAAELLYPSSAWGTNYVVLATPDGTASPQRLKFVDIVAFENGTQVTFSPAVSLPGGGGYPAVPATTSTSFTLNAGEYAHWETAPATTELSGSIVLATKPVSVTAGEDFFRLQPAPEPGGEATHAQIAPTSALGNDYAISPYATRRSDLAEESIYYRIVGIVDGTTLTYDPPVPAAPASTAKSQVSDFQVVGAFRVTSQDKNHPFAIAQVMSTGNVNFDGGTFRSDCATIDYQGQPKACGDEDFVPLLPPAQFLSSYVFFTDPTYSTTTLELVRVRSKGAFSDVTVDCLGVIDGWKPVDSADTYEYARADLLRAVPPGTVPDGGACSNGRHAATSKAPFGLVVYGLDTYSSYGYPAGGNAAVLSGVVVEPPK